MVNYLVKVIAIRSQEVHYQLEIVHVLMTISTTKKTHEDIKTEHCKRINWWIILLEGRNEVIKRDNKYTRNLLWRAVTSVGILIVLGVGACP